MKYTGMSSVFYHLKYGWVPVYNTGNCFGLISHLLQLRHWGTEGYLENVILPTN